MQGHATKVAGRATKLGEAKVVNAVNAKEATRVCQQDRKVRLRQFNEWDQNVLYNTIKSNPHEKLNPRDVNRLALKIVNLLVKEFGQIAGHGNKQDVLVKVLEHETIVVILLEYYPKPHETKTQLTFIQNFRKELNQVKRS